MLTKQPVSLRYTAWRTEGPLWDTSLCPILRVSINAVQILLPANLSAAYAATTPQHALPNNELCQQSEAPSGAFSFDKMLLHLFLVRASVSLFRKSYYIVIRLFTYKNFFSLPGDNNDTLLASADAPLVLK
ncbi:hypothetical protein, partial [Brenneria alni]|uniref:hypothetical protein n=1 Tax=Brenneria alni TaxID=71656 RepID=UPI00196B37A6